MITEWFLGWFGDSLAWLVGLLPDWDMPEELTDPGGFIETMLAYGSGLGVWIDWPLVTLIGAIPLAVWLIGLTWKMLRTAFSHVPFIGGSG